MFDSKQTLTTRLADATDLIIDFATLGEYGLEPVGSTPEGCDGTRQRPLPIADRQTFTEVLFPNRSTKPSATSIARPADAPCSARSRAQSKNLTRGSGPKLARKRGGRGASRPFSADSAA